MAALKKIYYSPEHPAGFAGANQLLNYTKNIHRDNVKKWLENQDAYTLHRPTRRRFSRRTYNVSHIDDVWEADLVDLRNIATYNDKIKYLLIVIDVLSKFVWVEPLNNKTSITVARAMERIFRRSNKRLPHILQTDRGREFLGSDFQKVLNKKEIIFRTVRNPDVKAAVVERFNRTLKERMWRYFTYSHTKRYIDVLQKIVAAYNNTKHSATKLRPVEIDFNNELTAFLNMKHRYENNKRFKKASKKPKYSVGDLVRVSKAKAAFTKGYTSGWSEEIFKIIRISTIRPPPVYILQDLNHQDIDGIFYAEELSKVGRESKQQK